MQGCRGGGPSGLPLGWVCPAAAAPDLYSCLRLWSDRAVGLWVLPRGPVHEQPHSPACFPALGQGEDEEEEEAEDEPCPLWLGKPNPFVKFWFRELDPASSPAGGWDGRTTWVPGEAAL